MIAPRLVGLAFLAACSDQALLSAENVGGVEDQLPLVQALRVDIDTGDRAGVMSQTWLPTAESNLGALRIELQPTFRVSGELEAFGDPDGPVIPGQTPGPFPGYAHIRQAASLSSDTDRVDEGGRFELRVPGGSQYDLVYVPDDISVLPLVVDTGLVLDANRNGAEVVDAGVPIHGLARDALGNPVEDLQVRLRHPSGFVSAPISSTATGHFLVRAGPGTWTLEVDGMPGDPLPALSVPVFVDKDDTEIDLDLDLGFLDAVFVSGRVRSAGGAVLEDALVRFRSERLSGAVGAYAVETTADRNGLFSARLLPGDYEVELIPPYGQGLGPISLRATFEADDGGFDIDAPALEQVSFQVEDRTGRAMADVVVTARELGFDRAVHAGTSDATGTVVMDLPDTAVRFVLEPSVATHAITTYDVLDPISSLSVLQVDTGARAAGQVLLDDEPVSNAFVTFRGFAGEEYGTVVTDDDGAFELRIQAPVAEE